MEKNRYFAAIALMICLQSPVAAKDTNKAYEGLLPKGFEVKTAAQPCLANDMAGKSVAIIPSATFVKYIDDYNKRVEKGGYGGGLFGGKPEEQTNQSYFIAADPRFVTDKVSAWLQGSGATVQVAEDLPAAKADGAKYFIILDFQSKDKMNWNPFSTSIPRVSEGGVFILDGALTQCYAAKAKGKGKYSDGGFLHFPGANESILRYAKGISDSHLEFLTVLNLELEKSFGLQPAPPSGKANQGHTP